MLLSLSGVPDMGSRSAESPIRPIQPSVVVKTASNRFRPNRDPIDLCHRSIPCRKPHGIVCITTSFSPSTYPRRKLIDGKTARLGAAYRAPIAQPKFRPSHLTRTLIMADPDFLKNQGRFEVRV